VEAEAGRVFGAPLYFYRNESFWAQDKSSKVASSI
jgi:2-hydroxychromene-2-carboxylate isomerase